MAKFQLNELIRPYDTNDTVRIADGAGAANPLADADVNKFVKMKGDSQYGLCAAGDEIEGFLVTADDAGGALYDGFKLGTIQKEGRKLVTLDGLQATPGTGVVAVGDYVVAGTVTARGTKLPGAPKVCKATNAKDTLSFLWRVVSLKGTTAVGQLAVIERV
ncbi:hypothetical protein J7E62_31030 [Variovorax paradoxus]|nr:hypothetical protein [Variovorax paradoxus]